MDISFLERNMQNRSNNYCSKKAKFLALSKSFYHKLTDSVFQNELDIENMISECLKFISEG